MKRRCHPAVDVVLAELTEFRRTHKGRAPLPPEIRKAIIRLADAGVSKSVLSRDLGVNMVQVRRWRTELKVSKPKAARLVGPRVLRVIPDGVPSSVPSTFGDGAPTVGGMIRMSHEAGRLLIEISLPH